MRSERPMIISEIMKTYRVGRSFVDREIKSGRLIAYNPTGRKYLIYPSDAEKWFQSTMVAPVGEDTQLIPG